MDIHILQFYIINETATQNKRNTTNYNNIYINSKRCAVYSVQSSVNYTQRSIHYIINWVYVTNSNVYAGTLAVL